MPTIRATTPDVLARVTAALQSEAALAAGNSLLSQSEQSALADGVLKDAAVSLRTAGGSGARVAVDALVTAASDRVTTLLGGVNTSGPGLVSQQEIRALHAANPDAGKRVARAYELITGKVIDLPTTSPTDPVVVPPIVPPIVPPTVPTGAQVAITSFTSSPAAPGSPYAGPITVLPGGAVSIERGAIVPSTFMFAAGGHTYTVTLDGSERMSGRATNIALPADVIEAIRRAVAPALDVRVTEHGSGKSTFELWPTPAPAPASGPVYLFHEARDAAGTHLYIGNELRGPLRFVCNHQATVDAGTTLTVRIDDEKFTATARQQNVSVKTLLRELRDQAVAAGHKIELKEYANFAPWTFIVKP